MNKVLPNKIPPHPRLLADADHWAVMQARVQTDAIARELFTRVLMDADAMLYLNPVEFTTDGKGIKGPGDALKRISTRSLAARLTGRADYVQAARRNLLHTAAVPDWNPTHFLDTATAGLALAVGYDWLYHELSPQERTTLEIALVEKALVPGLDPQFGGWWAISNNWNQVCHGGLAAAAIALADVEPGYAEQLLQRAISNTPHALSVYAPVGVYPEGPSYWGYGTFHSVLLYSALEAFCGQTFGLEEAEGFLQSPDFVRQATLPTGRFFNYADCAEWHKFLAPQFWFAFRLDRPELCSQELNSLRATLSDAPWLPFALLWQCQLSDTQHDPQPLPLNWIGTGRSSIAIQRSAWDEPLAACIALKGGSPRQSHGHMDVGSFVLEADGIRWAIDLGAPPSYRPGEKAFPHDYWNYAPTSLRWTIFCLGPEAHNILRINGKFQNVEGNAEIQAHTASDGLSYAIADLSTLYGHASVYVRRGVALSAMGDMVIQDVWQAKDKELEITWQFLTQASVEMTSNSIILSQEGKCLVLQAGGASFTRTVLAELPQKEGLDPMIPNLRRIELTLRTPAGESGRLWVRAIPGSLDSTNFTSDPAPMF